MRSPTWPFPVAPGGRLFIAVHRDQGWMSRLWLRVKQLYNSCSSAAVVVLGAFMPFVWLLGLFERRRRRSRVHEWLDWLSRLPFEVASAPAVLAFYRQRHFRLENLGLSGRPRLQRVRVLAFRDDAAAAAARAAEGTAGTGNDGGARVKVFFLIPSLVQGGAERQILELIAAPCPTASSPCWRCGAMRSTIATTCPPASRATSSAPGA
jgi:hypothetical protein